MSETAAGHEMVQRPGGVIRYTMHGGATREETVEPWKQCSRCGCSEGAINWFGWRCGAESEQRGQQTF